MSPTAIAAYLALFLAVGFLFLFVNLLVGRFLRPRAPNVEKLEIYECGEPTIGSSYVQFDLRFYVVALLFIIFDVEIAFFFPWAAVFGKASQLRTLDEAAQVVVERGVAAGTVEPLPSAQQQARSEAFVRLAEDKFAELGLADSQLTSVLGATPAEVGSPAAVEAVAQLGRRLAGVSLIDIGVFFAVLMVGFFYVWKRGDLDWVRAVSRQRALEPRRSTTSEPSMPAPALAG
jgi:NADH-quinone oxidoreductase subunit A